jgi:hypothetical protein
MVNYPGPIDPFERKKAVKIEEKQSKEESKKFKYKPVLKKMFIYLTILNSISKVSNYFTKNNKKKSLENSLILNDLMLFQKSLHALMEKDLSKEAEFLNYLAYIWIKFLNDFNQFEIENERVKDKLKNFIYSIKNYPKNQEFTLGYYLSNLAGYKWVPFPYMEMLKNLYLENKKDPSTSNLSKWIEEINNLINS